MFWNDIKEIKDLLTATNRRLCILDHNVARIENEQNSTKFFVQENISKIKECLLDTLYNSDDENVLDTIVAKLESLEQFELHTESLDKFEDYMKNVDKLNGLVNEFKGCVSMARASLEDKKNESAMNMEYQLKIDYLCENMAKIAEFMQKQEKKSHKTRKSAKKKTA